MLFKFLIILSTILNINNSPSFQTFVYWDKEPNCMIRYEIYPSFFSNTLLTDSSFSLTYLLSAAVLNNKNRYIYISNKTITDTIITQNRFVPIKKIQTIPLKNPGYYKLKIFLKDKKGINEYKRTFTINADTSTALFFYMPVPYLTVEQGDTISFKIRYRSNKTNELFVRIKPEKKYSSDTSFYLDPSLLKKNADTLQINLPVNIEPGKYTVKISSNNPPKNLSFPITILFSFTTSTEYYNDLIAALSYIYSPEALKPLKMASPSEREKEWTIFWAKRDPDPSTEENEALKQFLDRFNYANTHFSSYRKGWKTDMGRIYIKLGPPDNIEDHPFDINNKAYQVWYYSRYNLRFVFVDKSGFGEYVLVNKEDEPFINRE